MDPLVLLPLEVMVRPLELRFMYHFDGDRPTNRPDKVSSGGFLYTSFMELTNTAGIFSFTHRWIAQHIRRLFRSVSTADFIQAIPPFKPSAYFNIY